MLGPQAAAILGMSRKKTEELGLQKLIEEYGTLAFCCLAPEPRVRLTVREIRERHPQLLQAGVPSSRYYLDNDGQTTRLGFIRVDFGGAPEHIVRKCREDLENRRRFEPFRQLIDGGRFLIALVTAREEKAAAIHEAIKKHDWPIRFRIEVVPDLVHLIARFQSA